MANIDTPKLNESIDTNKRLSDLYERCEHNMLQLCKRFESMEANDFDPLKIAPTDIAQIQSMFPEWWRWQRQADVELMWDIDMLPNNSYIENSSVLLGFWDEDNNIRFRWNKIKGNLKF